MISARVVVEPDQTTIVVQVLQLLSSLIIGELR